MEAMIREDERIFTAFEEICEKYPDKPAIIYLGQKFSYSRLRELIYRFATALYDLGVRDNDRVMIYIQNCPQFLIAFLGTQEIGAIPVPISPIYTPVEIRYLINDSGAETILCQDTNFGYVKEVFGETCLKRIIVTNLVELLPWWKRIIGRMFDKVPHGVIELGKEVHLFRDLVRKYPPEPPKVTIDSKHLASLLYTGGTTGFPKGVPSTHGKMLVSIHNYKALTKDYIKPEEDVLIMVNPLFHMLGEEAILGWGLCKGVTVVLMPVPQVDAILEAIQRYRVTVFIGVPTLYRMILENDRVDLYDLSSLKYCWCGGDVLPAEVFRRWRDKFSVPIFQNYGCTEAACVTLSPLDKEPVLGSIGLPLPSKRVKIVHEGSLEPTDLNEPGELLVNYEHMTQSYWNKPEETAASFVEIDGSIWYRTNDFVRMDGEGLLYYVERGADIIKYKGYRVSCSEIEAVLQDHPAVIGACVVGVPDSKVGERIKAIVVLKEDARGVGATELIRWCRERLAPYKVPQYIEFRDMLPKSKVGKLLRREVREEERRRMAKEK